GGMVMYGTLRAGVAVKNVFEPTLGEGDLAFTLKRQARAGAAWSSAANTAFGGLTVAFDGDLLRVPTAFGEERRVAGGGGVWRRGLDEAAVPGRAGRPQPEHGGREPGIVCRRLQRRAASRRLWRGGVDRRV